MARQQGGVGAQLASGVRAFLMDLHYGYPTANGVVRTSFREERVHQEATVELLPQDREAVDRFIAQAGAASDDPEVYLCHLFCELGALRAEDTFRAMHDFLRENPNEVIVLILEDYVEPEDAIRALDRGGLADRALPWTPGQELPTLSEMISEDKNVLVLVEKEGGAEPWYIPAFEMVQDTRYDFKSVEEFSCEPLRGDEDNPLFMINHWVAIDPPDPNVARQANSRDVLLARANRCADERDLVPNIVAVDFYATGDLFDVVRELNGV